MMSTRYTFALFLLCLFITAQTARAQCTTDAGTISGGPFLCEGSTYSINNMANETLDSNDILIFVVYTGATPNASNVLATSTTVNFPYQPEFLVNSPFKVAAVAGNDAGGTVDWDDPCLSVSNVITVTCMIPPDVTATGGTLTCANPFVIVSTSVNQPNCTYFWSNGNVTPVTTVQQPGLYCVTVTNQAGCTAVTCTTVGTDVDVPVVNIAPPVLINCINSSVTLNSGGSSQGPDFQYTWSGPGISPANQTVMNPVVNIPGVYTLVVTNTNNGCTSMASIVVLQDASAPIADAGPDTGIPCGGGQVTLTGSASPAGQTIFFWTGVNIISGNETLNPVVDAPGTYTLIVTDVQNGCTAIDEVTVFPGPAIPQQDFAVTNATCQGINNGSIDLTMSVGQAPIDFAWSGPSTFSASTEDIDNLSPGTYNLVAQDNTGCTYYANVEVEQATSMVVTVNVAPVSCIGNDGTITLAVTGGTPPYTYLWNTGAITPTVQGISPGVYSVTITDASGCSTVVPPITITQQPVISLIITELSNSCSNAALQAIATGGALPYTYNWSGPNNFTSATPNINVAFSGLYTVIITDANGCSLIASYTVQLAGGGACGYLAGSVIRDTSENCVADPGEPGLVGWLVRAENATDTLYGVTNFDGEYLIGVPLGDYTVTAILPNNLWELCPPLSAVSVDVAGDTFPGGDIPVKKILDCPALSLSIGTGVLRRCFSNNYYYVTYCNDGTSTAEDAYIVITLDPFQTPLWSSLTYTNLGNNMLQFNVGDLDPGDCGAFSLQVQISCDAVLGQTHCTEAHIYPDSSCLPNDPLWSGASLKVSSQCDADSVRFKVQNIGTGDMSGTVDYVIIEDAVMLMEAPLQPLLAGNFVTLAFPANGSTWRLEVDQVPFHPGNSQPALSVEGCSANAAFTTGFVTQFTVNDADPWLDIDCTPNIGSYDPNDKQGFPAGYGAEHYIRPGMELEYLIRFQNTGTDTAFTVRVADTLSAWLDPTTVRPGASSHPYKFDLTGPGIVEFLFENILLPDSNVNAPASNGFVKFSVLPRADAPLETVIENEAAIYFDFNDPVITNTTYHRLGENFVVRAWQPFVPGAEVSVSPNPFSHTALLEVKGLQNSAPLRLRVFDLQGIMVREMESPDAIFQLEKGNWSSGIYLFQILQEGKLVGTGKISVQ